MLQYLQGVSGK